MNSTYSDKKSTSKTRRRDLRFRRPFFEALEYRSLLSSLARTGLGNGKSWDDDKNWNLGLSKSQDDVQIAAPGLVVRHGTGTDVVKSSQLSADLTLAVGSLEITSPVQLTASLTINGGQLSNSSIVKSMSGKLMATNAAGNYRVKVSAAIAADANKGNYLLTAFDATAKGQQLNINQDSFGSLSTPFATNQWNLLSSANQLEQLHLISRVNANLVFTLTGPNGNLFVDQASDSALQRAVPCATD